MRGAAEEDSESRRIMLGLLDAVDQDRAQSQRLLASELGIALGLANAYLRRCIKKGLLKVRQAPARRYAYYLTPQGFAEKSRLTVEYLSHSFSFFRQAKTDCSELIGAARERGVATVLLIGKSDLADITALCAMEHAVKIAGLVQKDAQTSMFFGAPIFPDFASVDVPFDALIVTDMSNAAASFEDAIARFGAERVLVPQLLRVHLGRRAEAPK